jgi:SAM-dependent methyltransferase
VSDTTFTGERLHGESALFGVDLARHQCAYEIARERVADGWVLDLGSGSGYGVASLSGSARRIVGADRVAPDAASRDPRARFVRARLEALPFAARSFELITSFQVIEHLEDPSDYVGAIARMLRPDGVALLMTPNRLMSDGVNPYHVHEYVADELAGTLRRRFDQVEMLGIGASEAVRRTLEARSRRIGRVMRLDPLGLRDRLPRAWVEWMFARFAVLVRRRGGEAGAAAAVSWRDFPVGPADDDCLDLLAICRAPR